ncbi:aquaporin, putative [Plasmodium knowlesi strain H]|uniref:Aquaporin, putative n=3 Tax=Plasmodium knowlesi TaxID=5850 RepID=A0A5K1V5B2_PLAKH|nr:aquaporin, putative [Plasmodium knowlesi strain H]OTN64124.1 putative Aquaporin [Plasmodium knowlesi]CAA9990900.1 aquaporin, putative [Plasmodium knowlesi strain H]SBO20876.1 aquaporin, putative [Plasmodium knowlesi strain H]SBO21321.1 aquaporin, putative [Plasmodium knowlesi strain H]VVS80374.1 aquaporin, putative [Plasmodium knowlesi strain H]|eukprot:XP_002262186.1 hypothetical protein, conserved in Plasmodium species [Plasmodium knowlesi strain H]
MKTQKGLFRRYAKQVIQKFIKYTKNYLKDITDEINVKSFKKYKYNFFFEFIGSFIFVFFISVYMLNSNQNEEYVIKHTKQINPYDSNDIFIPGDNLFDNEINNVHYGNDLNGPTSVASILLEQKNKEDDATFKTKEEHSKVYPMVSKAEGNNGTNRLIGSENIEHVSEETKGSLVKKHEMGKRTSQEYSTNGRQTTVNGVSGNNDLLKSVEKDETKKTDSPNGYVEKSGNKDDILRQSAGPSEGGIEKGTTGDVQGESNENIDNNQREEKTQEERSAKELSKEGLTKNVGTVIFKDHVNEFSKIKLNDINNIDLGDIDKYQVMKNSGNKQNSNHAVYSFFGCLIYVLFVILGAHINPAYTYALWLVEPKKYGFVITTCYVTFQYFGGILASILCAHMYGSIFIYALLPKKEIMKTFFCEFISTFLLTLLLLSLYNYKKKFMEENKNENSLIFNTAKGINMTSLYTFSNYEDIYGSDVFNSSNWGGRNERFLLHVDNKYIKYIMNHIFYLLFIFFSLLFFVFVTNTTLNPMFSTSTLYTYLYFKFFQANGSFHISSVVLSFLSVSKIFQMVKLYITSLPLWIGPYVGSAFATAFMKLFKEGEEEIVNVIDTNVYSTNRRNETMPLIGKHNVKRNAYLVEYDDNIHHNSSNYLIPNVF